jgi:TonB family protein
MEAAALKLTAEQRERLQKRRGQDPEAFYPPRARAERIDGYVSVALLLNAEGFVLEAEVLRESPPDMGFGLAALDTTKTWEFDNPFRQLVRTEVIVAFQP